MRTIKANEQAKKRLHILFTLTSAKSMAGQQRFVFEAAKEMRKKGHRVTLLTFFENCRPEMERMFAEKGIAVAKIHYRGAFLGRMDQFSDYPREIRKLAPDVIFTYMSILSNAAVASGVPTVNYYWGNVTVFSEFMRNPARWVDNYLFGYPTIWLAKKNICCSNYMERQLEQIYFKKSDGMVHCGIDTARVYPSKKAGTAFRKKYKISPHASVVGTIGRFAPYKNHMHLLEYARHNRNATIVIAGSGEMEKEYSRYIAEHGLSERVFVLKGLPERDLNGFFNSLDVYAHTSGWEGFGIPPLEAAACGVFPIGYARASITEVIPGRPLGALARTKEEFFRKISDKISNPDGRLARTRAALRRRFAEGFSWRKVSSGIEEEIVSAADSSRASGKVA